MTEPHPWEHANEAYLEAALTWLRLKLQALIPADWGQEPSGNNGKSSKRRGHLFGKKEATGQTVALREPGQATSETEALTTAWETMTALAAGEHMPGLPILTNRFGLSDFESQVLLLCAAMELDTGIAALCAAANRDMARPWPSFALAMRLFDEPAWDILSPERPLRYWRLVDINQGPNDPLTVSPLRAEERIINFIKGLNYLDDRLSSLLMPLETEAGTHLLPPSQQEIVSQAVAHLNQPLLTGQATVIQLTGNDRSSKRLISQAVAETMNIRLFALPQSAIPSQPAECDALARLWSKESVLLPIALYLDEDTDLQKDGSGSGKKHGHSLRRFLARARGVFFLACRETNPAGEMQGLILETAKPEPGEQEAAWQHLIGTTLPQSPLLLAGQFNLSTATIQSIGSNMSTTGDGDLSHAQIWQQCLVQTRPRMDLLAQRLNAKACWQDIVLPSAERTILEQITAQVIQRGKVYHQWGFAGRMNRGMGINALFAGASGTGKTMAAEVIANALGLNLYRIDLSAVISKYIGETEKNLRRLFDAAEDGGVILFFDEADALFGKRSEVKDSHDRYANIEINYLLQRMEAYRGLAILATNMKSAMDSAFVRRLRFIVNFPFPGQQQRREIWEKAFPAETPVNGLDFKQLARLNLTGGSIHNIALNAAFLAAHADESVGMGHIRDAARAEYRKIEQPFNEALLQPLAVAGGPA